ncbi:MAG TPA: EF-hand domain-containing protein [Nevskia sp.]|nr:EF-hand domain-containing protein [Nevskia sp.]
MNRDSIAAGICIGLLVLWSAGAALADPAPADRTHLGEMGDPYVPPASRIPSPEAPTSGEALRRQVDAKLRRQFDAADPGHTGAVTLERARQAGWGYLVKHFDRIDTAGNGSVSFEQVRQYQRAAAARR